MSKAYKDLLLKEVKELFKKLPPNVRIRVYYDDMGKSKYTLNELGTRMDGLEERMDRLDTKLNQIGDALFEFIKVTNERFNRIDKRIDNLTNDVNSLKQEVKDINARLDYNGLKQLPK